MTRCTFFLAAKQRACHFEAVGGSSFCHHHDSLLGRVPCPINPRHTVAADKVAAHVLVCPDALRDPRRLPCYSEGVNLIPSPIAPSTAPSDQQDVISNVRRAHDALRLRHRPALVMALGAGGPPPAVDASHSQKHTPQHRGLADVVFMCGAIDAGHTYVEMCAGKAGLACYLRAEYLRDPATRVVAIDRQNFRRKKDASGQLERIRIDVGDLDFPRLPGIGDAPAVTAVVVGKHACGGATDLTLRCVTAPGVKCNVPCIVIALCCHQLCTAPQYVGQAVLSEFGISAADFAAMCHMSSWAVDGGSSEDRRSVGLMCKEVLNLGRAEYMVGLGYDARLVQYCDEASSKENIALVCTKGPANPIPEKRSREEQE